MNTNHARVTNYIKLEQGICQGDYGLYNQSNLLYEDLKIATWYFITSHMV